MQLTKDDVITEKRFIDIPSWNKKYLDFSKFQQVVEFYEKYKDNAISFSHDFPKLWSSDLVQIAADEETTDNEFDFMFKDWIFSYCFKDGLK